VRTVFRGGHTERFLAQTLQMEVGSSVQALRVTLENISRRHGKPGPSLDALLDLAGSADGSTKITGLLDLLRRHDEKMLVFTRYRETQKAVLNALEQAGIPGAEFGGHMSTADKDEQVAAFAAERRVMVSTDVGSEGRNLQFCHTLVNYDLPWNPMVIEQRVGRVHRIGQTEAVNIYNLSARDTVEDYVLEVLDSKINMFELVVGEVGEILGNLDEERDFEDTVLDLWAGADSTESARAAFDRLGEDLAQARRRYQEAQEYDQALFGEEFVAEEI
jgi:SNF2 family DNA or RNA helicase